MRTIFFNLWFLLLLINSTAQDMHFVNQEITKSFHNPSYVGHNEKDFMIGMIYRDQWSEMEKLYKTYSLFGELLLPNKSRRSGDLGIGLLISRDNAGYVRLGTNQVGLTIAYHTKLNDENSFSGGIYGGILNQHLLQDNMKWDSQYNGIYYDAALSSNENIASYNFTKPDMGAGLSYTFNNRKQKSDGFLLQAGFSMFHLNKPEMSYTSDGTDKLNIRQVFHLNGIYDIPRSIVAVNPTIVFMSQGPSKELLMSLRGIFDITKSSLKGGNIQKLWAGFNYRIKDAVIAEIGIQSYNVAISFAYDWTISTLKAKGIGAFELGLKYNLSMFKSSSNRLL